MCDVFVVNSQTRGHGGPGPPRAVWAPHLRLLSHQVGFKNMQNVEHIPLSLDRAMRLVKDVFISAAERDVYTGDALKICIVTKEGIREETITLRKD